MNKEKIYMIIAVTASGLMVLFGIMFLIFSSKWKSLGKTSEALEDMLAEAVKETAQLKSELKALSENQSEEGVLSDSGEDRGEESGEDESDLSSDGADEEDAQLSPDEEADAVADLTLLEPQLDDMLTEASGAAGGEWSIYIKNMNSGIYTERSNIQMKAASLIKLFIMGAVYEQYESLCETNGKETVDGLLDAMIIVSDNDSANQLVTLLGGGDSSAGRQVVTEYCTEHDYSGTSMGRMLLEENTNGENYTTVGDCASFLEGIYYKEFDYWAEMLDRLESQQRRSKIPAQIPDGVAIANKTGELTGVENDVAIVYGEKNPYIICIMTDGLTDSSVAVDCIAEMSGQIYGFFNQ